MKEIKIFENLEDAKKIKEAIIKTQKGAIKLQLFPSDAPIAVLNFATLAKDGFYNGLNFHRVIPNFVAQGGCPIGTGTGGPGYAIPCEVKNNKQKHVKGALSMAHAGRDTGGSQFFICFAPQPHLDGEHTVFGAIASDDSASFAVLDNIKQGDIIETIEIIEEK